MASKRRPNFSNQEQAALVDIIAGHPEVFKKFSGPGQSKNQKEENWRLIQTELAALFQTSRSVEEIKKKWTDMKYAAIKEVARFRRESGKTGGGPPPTAPEDLHHKIISIVGEEAVDGVVGGIDTAQDLSDHCNAGEGDHAQPDTSDGLHYGEQARPLKKKDDMRQLRPRLGPRPVGSKIKKKYVAAEMLKTQQGILASLKELVATQQRSVSVQERLLALEEC